MDNTNIDLIRSHMDTIILRTLQNSDKYGLEILNEIKTLSNDLYTVKQPTLYSSLKRLETQGLILSCPSNDESKGANRIYYRLTDEGRAFLEADQSQWEFARTIIDKLLSDKEFDKDAEKPFEPSDYRPLTKRTKKETEEKVVVKYVEIEKPVYIDKATGERLDNYSPNANQENVEDNFEDSNNNFTVYSNRNDDNAETASTESISNVNSAPSADNEQLQTNETNSTDNNIAEQNSINSETNSSTQQTQIKYIPIERPSISSETNDFEEEYSEEYNDYHVSSTQMTEESYYDNDYSNDRYASRRSYTPEIDHNAYIDDKIDYVSLIQDVIIESENTVKNNEIQPISGMFDDYDGEVTMTDLQHALESKNIVLKRYQKSNTVNYYSGNFFYSNKLLRDWSWLTYLMYLIFIVTSYIAGKNVGIQWTYSLGFALGGLILPIACTIVWSGSPLRKKRNNLTLNNALLSSFILVLAFLLIILIVAFFVTHIDIQKAEEYVPALVVPCCSLMLLPISVMFYAVLFKVKSYHLK